MAISANHNIFDGQRGAGRYDLRTSDLQLRAKSTGGVFTPAEHHGPGKALRHAGARDWLMQLQVRAGGTESVGLQPRRATTTD